MGWYVEVLWLNKDMIRAKGDIESDELQDLLLVEATITTLRSNKQFTDEELGVLDTMLESANFFIASTKLNLNRSTVSKIFRKVCNKISYKLGGYFTDEGYLSYLESKYNLTSEQIETLRGYMNSKLRYKLARQIYEQTEKEDNDEEFCD